jgi:hypothetical protein
MIIMLIKKKGLGFRVSNRVNIARFSMLDCLLGRCKMLCSKNTCLNIFVFKVNKPFYFQRLYIFHICSHFEVI